MSANLPIRILLVDDSPYFLNVARDFLHMQESFEVSGVAVEGRNALDEARRTQPDIILLDLNLGNQSGLRLIPLFKKYVPAARIIILTIMDDDEYHRSALQAGADAFVPKTRMTRELVDRIMEVMELHRPQADTLETQRQRSDGSFISLIENSEDLIYRYEFVPKRGFTYVNPAVAALTGYTPQEHYANPDLGFKLVYPDDRHNLEAAAAQAKTDPNRSIPLRWVRKDGSICWAEQKNVSIFNEDGELIALEGIIRDVTARKQAEDKIEFQAKLLAAVGNAVIATDPNGRVTYWNQAAENLYGWSASEALGGSILDLTPTQQTREQAQEILEHLAHGEIWSGEFVVQRKDGSVFMAYVSDSPVHDSNGKLTGIIGVSNDITVRKQAEESIRWQNAYLAALQKTTLELLSEQNLDVLLENIVRRAGQLVDTNSGCLELVDADTGQMIPTIGLGALAELLLYEVKPGQGLAGIVWKTGTPLLVRDYDSWEGRPRSYPAGRLSSVIGVPLTVNGRILGVLGLGYEYGSQRIFKPEDLDILSQFAHLAAIAIESARLFSNLRQEVDEHRLAEEKVKQQMDELRRWYEATLNRESDILKLKHEVNDLLQNLDKPIRYPSAE